MTLTAGPMRKVVPRSTPRVVTPSWKASAIAAIQTVAIAQAKRRGVP